MKNRRILKKIVKGNSQTFNPGILFFRHFENKLSEMINAEPWLVQRLSEMTCSEAFRGIRHLTFNATLDCTLTGLMKWAIRFQIRYMNKSSYGQIFLLQANALGKVWIYL